MMKIADITPTMNWWEAGVIVPLGDGYMDLSWVEQALAQQALVGAPAKMRVQVEGNLTGPGFDELRVAFESRQEHHEGPRKLTLITDDISVRGGQELRVFYSFARGAVTLMFDGDIHVTAEVVTNDREYADLFINFFKTYLSDAPPPGRVHVVIETREGPGFTSMGIAGIPLERGNYMPQTIADYDRVVADIRARTPAGRIAIFDGPPGTGKTYLIRGLLDEIKDATFVIVPANLIARLAQPGTIPALLKLKKKGSPEVPIVFIVEDADEVLAPRAADNMDSITNMLNFGDGILGSLLDIRIVATTNAKRQDLDEAILRPGRLSVVTKVEGLSAQRAGEIYHRLTGKSPFRDMISLSLRGIISPTMSEQSIFKNGVTLAEVYSLARDDGWTPPVIKRHAAGFSMSEPPEED